MKVRTSRYVVLFERSHDEFDNEEMTEDEAVEQLCSELQQAIDDLGVPNGMFRIVNRHIAEHGDLFGPVFVPAIVLGPAKPRTPSLSPQPTPRAPFSPN